ncbi:efflux RND transporter permease subunit [bacterium]|nr:efflux RND transporter permease subunit [bacterium]
MSRNSQENSSLLGILIEFCLRNKLVVILGVAFFLGWGALVAPFDWELGNLPRDPVPVDAIPDIGENQQIVFTEWMGRSPQDVEDQITYPLTVSLLGVPGVKTVRSYSMFGFSTIYIIFKEGVDFYWSRSRVLEKLNSLSAGTLPAEVQPTLGPDATALGQVFWYTLEGQDSAGNPTGGWDLDELRSVQDWQIRYALLSADGVSEVASVGGFVREYQIDVDPDAMRAFGVSLEEVFMAVKNANVDVGARTIEVNQVEYVIRGVGFIKSLKDIEQSVIKVNDNVPVYVKNVANVVYGPALRRGALDKEGVEAVGGVAVVRYGENPLQVIQNIQSKIAEISPGLPKKTLADGTISQLAIVPFYDRTGLINETLETLNAALTEEILVTIIVVLVMVMHLRSSILISGLLPLSVLMCFSAMKIFGVDANIVALSGIAIAIGTMVDMGIVICENILKHLDEAHPDEDSLQVVLRASKEVGSAVLTAVATTVVSFLPVFTMEAAEGKLFTPLAWTKTFALLASVFVAITVIPPFAHTLFAGKLKGKILKRIVFGLISGVGMCLLFVWFVRFSTGQSPHLLWMLLSIVLLISGGYRLAEHLLPEKLTFWMPRVFNSFAIVVVGYFLAQHWLPLGPGQGVIVNFVFVGVLIGSMLFLTLGFLKYYVAMLEWCLGNRLIFILLPIAIVIFGGMAWLGFNGLFGWLPNSIRTSQPIVYAQHLFPGLGKEFMPSLDEGSYLYMPTTMPHASIGESMDAMRKQDMAIRQIPEVNTVVGKLGRAETPLDPAPISMVETVINYKPEYLVDDKGHRLSFKFDPDQNDFFRAPDGLLVNAHDGKPYTVRGRFERDASGELIEDLHGQPFRLWRLPLDPVLNQGRTAWAGVQKPEDIWNAIVQSAKIPGSTSAPKLQPIAARIVMLQSGMRAPMGIKIKGPNLETIERVGMEMERMLKEVPSIEPSTVIADRIVGKPYLEIVIDREAIARYGIQLARVQEVIEVGIGGKLITTTVEGRERYPVRVRYLRELRDQIESLGRILVPAPNGNQIPLQQLAKIEYLRGPQSIKSEDTFLIGYVLFDMKPGYAEVDVVEMTDAYLKSKIDNGTLEIPDGVSFTFAGSYENQVRSEKRLMVVLPLALFVIFLILYLQFRSTSNAMLVFSGILVAWAGGFIMLWLYGQEWFLNFSVLDFNLRELFQVRPFNLSVAVWVGFLALFGIASDNGVIMATYLDQKFRDKKLASILDIRRATIEAGVRRARPCMMTTATTVLALIPILTSTGRGSDIMVPMAIPSFGGMLVVVISIFVVPVLYCAMKEFTYRSKLDASTGAMLSAATLFLLPLIYCSVMDKRQPTIGSKDLDETAKP